MDERWRSIEAMLNQARRANNAAASNEDVFVQHDEEEPNTYDIPMRLLKMKEALEVSDPDIRKYQRDLASVPKSVYTTYQQRKKAGQELSGNWKIDEHFGNSLAGRLRKKTERNKRKNAQAADYDVSGRYQVDFINDKNKRFNKKLAREYNEYAESLHSKV